MEPSLRSSVQWKTQSAVERVNTISLYMLCVCVGGGAVLVYLEGQCYTVYLEGHLDTGDSRQEWERDFALLPYVLSLFCLLIYQIYLTNI